MKKFSTRTLVFVFPATLIWILPAFAASSYGRSRPAADPNAVTKVFEVKYARPTLVAATMEGVGGATYKPLEDAGAILVTARASEFEQIQKLIHVMDVPPSLPTIKIYKVAKASVEDMAQTLRSIFPDIKIATDTPRRSLIVVSPQHGPIEHMLEQLDREALSPIVPTMSTHSLRLVWLINDEKLPPPPPDLKDAIDELGAAGVSGLRLAAQVMAVANGRFTVQASPALAAILDCHLKMEGELGQGTDLPLLELSLSVTGTNAEDRKTGSELAALKTQLSIPPGHKLVLGVVPVGKYTSVFVIQLVDAPGTKAATPPTVGGRSFYGSYTGAAPGTKAATPPAAAPRDKK